MDDNKFDGVLPSELGLMSALQVLQIGYNRFVGELPSELGQLSNLVTVDVCETDMSYRMPPQVCDLTTNGALQRVDCSEEGSERLCVSCLEQC